MVNVDAEQLVTLVTFLATSLAVVAYLNRGLSALGDRIDKLDAKIDGLDARLTDRIDRLDAKIDGVEISLRAEMRAGFASIDTRFVALEGRITTLESRLYDLAGRLPAAAGPPAER